MINIYEHDFTNKVILEVGTARGGTTRELVKILSRFSNTRLITTDIFDGYFENLKKEFQDSSVSIDFIKTDACELKGIENNSVDYIICNYTLCAINSKSCAAVTALNRFKEVLREGGTLYIEEEFPINHVKNESQQIWSEKWRILKTCTNILGDITYNEMDPEIVKEIVKLLEFKKIECEFDSSVFHGEDCLNFFNVRLNRYLERIKGESLKQGVKEEANKLMKKVIKLKCMEVPYYKIIAQK